MGFRQNIPEHLKRYVVAQDYSRYTAIDQATWRFVMRQLEDFLSKHAHECYLEGLEKTGISIDEIPRIEDISRKIEKFGWQAVPVSGFIPPAAFMELQSLGFLPIAGDMRTAEHLMYTPAPDIVHEAAGHAPILVNTEFATYLKNYAQVARKAIISNEDLNQYEAIRVLSDLKEDPATNLEQIREAEKALNDANKKISHISEAALLARMNWWTAEYGLIGSLDDPKIYGAGLLSSVGESRSCLEAKVKKIPFSLKCTEFAYDITEKQPQLFVTPDFKTLITVLEELASTMAFRRGGVYGLELIQKAKSVNTVQYNSGVQVSGVLERFTVDSKKLPAFLKFSGACQLSFAEQELTDQGKVRHAHGFSSPVGFLKGHKKCLSDFTDQELSQICVKGDLTHLEFESGVTLTGEFISALRRDDKNGASKLIVLTFKNCRVELKGETLFNPAWGEYDMAVGSTLPSVFGGPADRDKFGALDDFAAKRVPDHPYSTERKALNKLYDRVREVRREIENDKVTSSEEIFKSLDHVFLDLQKTHKKDWVLKIEMLELTYKLDGARELQKKLRESLQKHALDGKELKTLIDDGIRLAAF